MALAIVNFPRPVLDAICLAKRPDSEKIKICIGSNSDRNRLHGIVRSIEVGHRVFISL